ncbi:MAG: hypothetical protein H6739_33395 [Alphaproteobacteria bacterium]|nr:hypothetical protein [Alphaproteobacteria bacterium]
MTDALNTHASAWRMVDSGVPLAFVKELMALVEASPAIQGLIRMWDQEPDAQERAETLVALQELVEDNAHEPGARSAERLDDDDALLAERMAWKAHLRRLVDAHGGVSAVARRAGLPQPSLSRMLSTPSEPRAKTLMRLAAAMGVEVGALHPTEDEPEKNVVHLSEGYRAEVSYGELLFGVRSRPRRSWRGAR